MSIGAFDPNPLDSPLRDEIESEGAMRRGERRCCKRIESIGIQVKAVTIERKLLCGESLLGDVVGNPIIIMIRTEQISSGGR